MPPSWMGYSAFQPTTHPLVPLDQLGKLTRNTRLRQGDRPNNIIKVKTAFMSSATKKFMKETKSQFSLLDLFMIDLTWNFGPRTGMKCASKPGFSAFAGWPFLEKKTERGGGLHKGTTCGSLEHSLHIEAPGFWGFSSIFPCYNAFFKIIKKPNLKLKEK